MNMAVSIDRGTNNPELYIYIYIYIGAPVGVYNVFDDNNLYFGPRHGTPKLRKPQCMFPVTLNPKP